VKLHLALERTNDARSEASLNDRLHELQVCLLHQEVELLVDVCLHTLLKEEPAGLINKYYVFWVNALPLIVVEVKLCIEKDDVGRQEGIQNTLQSIHLSIIIDFYDELSLRKRLV